MEQYPGGPREEKRSTAWRVALGCGAGCLVLLIAGGVACGLVCGHLTQRSKIARDQTVMAGGEIGHAWLYVTESDPGMAAIRRHLEQGMQRMAERASKPGTKTHLSGMDMFLPLRLQVRAYPPVAGDDDPVLVGEIELSGSYNLFATFLRFMGRERREALARGGSLYTFPDDEGGFVLGVEKNRFVVSRAEAAVRSLVDGSHAPAPMRVPAPLARLADAARLPTEDAAAWATGGADQGLGWMNFGALSADIVTEDRVEFRAVFDVPEGVPREEAAKRVEGWIRERLPEELSVTLGNAEWLDARTVRYAGTVTGLAAALDGWMERETATTATPRSNAYQAASSRTAFRMSATCGRTKSSSSGA